MEKDKDKEKLIVEYETPHGKVKLSPAIIRNFLTHGNGRVSDQEVLLFMNLCRYQRLNPFLREAYLIKYSDKEPATMVVGKDAFIKRASKHEKFNGMKAGIFVLRDGKVEKRIGTLVLPDEDLVGGWAEVYRKDWDHPVEITVSYNEYVQRKKDGEVNRMWSTKPATMIRKVALAQALREAYPDEFQGIYDESEIDTQSLTDIKVENYEVQTEEKESEEDEEIKKLKDEIISMIIDPAFTGMAVVDGKEVDLDYYREELKKKLIGRKHTKEKLEYTKTWVEKMLEAGKKEREEEKQRKEEQQSEQDKEIFEENK